MSAPPDDAAAVADPAAAPAPAPAPGEEALTLADAQAKKRMLIIVNPYAATVSDRLRHLVVYALQGRFEVDAVDTEGQGHATVLCREAAHEGYDVVVAFGGDGTVNEAANGLAGSSTPLTCLPGGSANVFGRLLGIPGDVVDATEHLLRLADDWHPRRVDLASVNGRHFVFSSGLGIDASVVERVDQHPRLKARYGPWWFTYAAVAIFARRYLRRPPRLTLTTADLVLDGVTAIVQSGAPFTYFRNRPIEVAEGASLDSGTLAGCVLHRANALDMPFITWRAFSRRARLTRHRQVTAFADVEEVLVRSADGRPLPLQVDGDFLGEVQEARYTIASRRLMVVG